MTDSPSPSSVVPRTLSAPRVIGSTRAALGEGLCWSPGDEALYWVDILSHKLYRETIALSGHREWSFDETISAVSERHGVRGLAITLRRGLALFDPDTGEILRLDEPEPDRPTNRFNDGKCDARGRFWGGTMDFDARAPTGSLYRYDGSGTAVRAIELGWAVTNGPTWSLDLRTMFVNDTVRRRVVAHEFDIETGAVGAARDWLVFSGRNGNPDGMTTDAAGRLWIAHWGGSCVTCHDPATAAELLRIELPTAHISNVAFGGRDLTTLFVTSARSGLDAGQLAAQPLAGALFSVEVDAVGSAPGLFDG